MTYETFRLLALASWLDDECLTIVGEPEIEWANECIAAGIVFA